jgi:PAS domain S-box-containing protein
MKKSLRYGVGSGPGMGEGSQAGTTADFRQLWLALQAYHLEMEAQNEQLRQSLEQLEHERDDLIDFYNATPVACLATDRNDIITSANLKMEALVGRPAESLRNKRMADLFDADDQNAYHFHRMSVMERGEGGETFVCELRVRREGDPVWVSVETMAVCTGGQIRKLWSVLRDITSRKKSELERDRAIERAQAIEKLDAIGTLAGGVARDLKDILTEMMMGLKVEARSAGEDGDSPSTAALAAVARGSRLTQQLLEIARCRSQPLETFRPDVVAERAFEALGRTAPERVRVRLMLGQSAGWIEGDSDRCLQMLMHVCRNAIEAIPGQGVITLAVRDVSPGEPCLSEMPELCARPHVAIEVVDDGGGMDAATLRHACEPYFTTKHGGKTAGLGLSAVYGTVRAWGGGMAIASSPGHGTRVSMLFPARGPC